LLGTADIKHEVAPRGGVSTQQTNEGEKLTDE